MIDYTNYIQKHVARGLNCCFSFLNEESGVNDNARLIVDKLYNLAITHKYLRKGDVLILKLKNVILGDDTFLNNLNIEFIIEKGEEIQNLGSAFYPSRAELQGNDKSGKWQLVNTTIKYRQSSPTMELDKSLFYQLMWHELLHAYRLYNIYIDYDEPTNGQNYSNQTYQNAARTYLVQTGIIKDLGKFFYKGTTEEIDAMANEIVPFIESKKQFNNFNYQNYLKDFSLYRYIEELKTLRNTLNEILVNNDKSIADICQGIRKIIGNKYSKLNDNNLIKRTLANIDIKISYAENKLYKIIDYCIDVNESRYYRIPEYSDENLLIKFLNGD